MGAAQNYSINPLQEQTIEIASQQLLGIGMIQPAGLHHLDQPGTWLGINLDPVTESLHQ
jgi:hypothetical protein